MNWIKQLFSRRQLNADLSEEIQEHLVEKVEELVAGGISREEATYAARREFGNVLQIEERSREVWQWPRLENFFMDVRYGVRRLAMSPGFTAVAVLTLALGIGANTAIFSVISGVLLRKPPVGDPDKVMMVLSTNRARGWGDGPEHPASAPDFLDWRNASHAFGEMAAIAPWGDFNLTGQGEPLRVAGMRVSANFFHLLGVHPSLGRTFSAGEDERDHDRVAILGYGLWQTHFASDPTVVGRIIKLNQESYTVVGVMPASFKLFIFPSQIWIPLSFDSKQLGPAGRQSRQFYVFGRLQPEATAAQAQAEMAAMAQRLEQSYPATNKGWEASLISLQEFQIQDFHIRAALLLLMGTVGLVLLIACANIAGLLLARGAGRQHEIAVRSAMGAGRGRLVRQFLSENGLIAIAGAGVGLTLAGWGIRILHAALGYSEFASSLEFGIDARVLVFTLSLSLFTVLLFGLTPALQVSRSDLCATLKEGGRSGGAGVARAKARRVFVVAELAMALVLVTGAGLMIKSFLEAIGAGPGFDPEGLLTAEISLPALQYSLPFQRATFCQQVIEKVQSIPSAASAGAATALPLGGAQGRVAFTIEGQTVPAPQDRPQATYYAISPNYLQTMRIPLLRGRTFTDLDRKGAPLVLLVNEALARRCFPQGDAIGRYISLNDGNEGSSSRREVVGVVGNVKEWFGEEGFSPQLYAPFLQAPENGMTLVIRTKGDAATLASAVRAAVWSVDKDQPLGSVMTMTQFMQNSGVGGERVVCELLGTFGALALILAAVGVYGIIAQGVAQRTHEIGIRMALGAGRRNVLRVVVGEGMRLAAFGLLIGLAFASALPGLFGAAFEGFNVHATWVFVVALPLVAFAALLASYLPARRATKVDPLVALRYE